MMNSYISLASESIICLIRNTEIIRQKFIKFRFIDITEIQLTSPRMAS